MRIRKFAFFIQQQLESFVLRDTDLVVDGQNFLYNAYRDSKLPYAFGAESDKFANYLRQYFENFKRANIKCFFIFKGGHRDILTKLRTQNNTDRQFAADFVPGTRPDTDHILLPIFMKEIYKQVLDEMGFQYSISTYEAKADCVALARKLKCPILSNDVEFCLFGVPYIPYRELHFDEGMNAFTCGVFYLKNFMAKFNLNEDVLAMFVVLMNEHSFELNFFAAFMKSVRIPTDFKKRIQNTLVWLSRTSKMQAEEKIFCFIDDKSKEKFSTEFKYFRGLIDQKPPSTITTHYLQNANSVQVEENDSEWFQKGVCLQNIPITYVNLYKWKIMFGSWAIEDLEKDALHFSTEIVKYAFDLLTNFKQRSFTFAYKKRTEIEIETSIQKPAYEATASVFENGWNNIHKLRLFEHFLDESLGKFDVTNLDVLSDDVKLTMIALVYFSWRKETVVKNEVYSVLLSHLMLGVVFEKINNNLTEDFAVTVKDCEIAESVMDKYFQLTSAEERDIFDRKMLHPLVEFQHCLQQLNFLNTLCGKPFKPTVYHRTYNATFVYKILYAMEQHNGNEMGFLKTLLKPAPSVWKYFKSLVKIYEQIISNQLYG